MQINYDNEVVGMITRKDLAAPINIIPWSKKLDIAKKTTVIKATMQDPKKPEDEPAADADPEAPNVSGARRRTTAARAVTSASTETESNVPYQQL